MATLSSLVGNFPRTLVLVGSGNFIVPANVFSLSVSLIGGGGGGGAVVGPTSGAASGGGSGSGLWRYPMAVTPGQTIAYSCGTGGLGGVASASSSSGVIDTGDNGTATVFGELRGNAGLGGRVALDISVSGSGPYQVQSPAGSNPVQSVSGFVCSFSRASSYGIDSLLVAFQGATTGDNGGGTAGTGSFRATSGAGSPFSRGGAATFGSNVSATAENSSSFYGAGGGGVVVSRADGTRVATAGSGGAGVIFIEYTGPAA